MTYSFLPSSSILKLTSGNCWFDMNKLAPYNQQVYLMICILVSKAEFQVKVS